LELTNAEAPEMTARPRVYQLPSHDSHRAEPPVAEYRTDPDDVYAKTATSRRAEGGPEFDRDITLRWN